jgi:dihydrofolate synthase / folylpolyglutamate synthase
MPNFSVTAQTLIDSFLTLHPKLIDLSLTRVHRLLAALDNPQHRLPPTIHVAGTNGKGSTIAFLRAILEASGKRVHVYTSPHLVRFHERIRLSGALISEEYLLEVLQRCETANKGAAITLFEMTTAAALIAFSETPADVLLLEVGLGGRLDATNVIARPAAAVVTNIGLDHTEFLGDTLSKIATEKAGIFKKGCPAIVAKQVSIEAEDTLLRCAEAVRATPIWVGGQEFFASFEHGRCAYQDDHGLLDLPLPRLKGLHQLDNLATALATLRVLGLLSDRKTLETGLARVDWPARLQSLRTGALVRPHLDLWLDGGHNVDGARRLAVAMADLHDKHPLPLILVLGMLANKDARGFLQAFQGLATRVIAVPIEGHDAHTPEALKDFAHALGMTAAFALHVGEALQSIETPTRVLITGSLYLAGSVLEQNGILPV